MRDARRLLVCTLGLFFCLGASASPAEQPGSPAAIDDLAWLGGSWLGEFEGAPFEAYYTSPAGGVILSASKQFLPGGCFYEFEKFEQRGGAVYLTPYPRGEKSASFLLVGYDPNVPRARFENPAFGFPTDITYALDGPGRLQIVVGGRVGDERRELQIRLEQTSGKPAEAR